MTVVDHQTHWFPREALEAFQFESDYPRAVPHEQSFALELMPGHRQVLPGAALDLELQLRETSESGIDLFVTSPIHLGEVMHLDPDEAAEYLEKVNAIVATAQRRHSDRLAGLALLPMQDATAALRVLDSSVELGLRGVQLLASVDGKTVADESLLPVYARIAELRLPVFLHPCVRSNTRTVDSNHRLEAGLAWMYHTALAAFQLMEGGVFDNCPGLTVVHPHLGGMLPYIAGRINDMPRTGERSVYDYLRENFYADVVGVTPAALEVAIRAYGIDRLVFGTDYPFIPIERAQRYVADEAGDEAGAMILSNVVPGVLPAAGSAPD